MRSLADFITITFGFRFSVPRATSATARAEHVDAPQATALGGDGVSVADTGRGDAALSDPPPMPRPTAVPVGIASLGTPDPERNEAKEATGSVKVADTGRGGAALSDPPPMSRPAAVPVGIASLSTPDPERNEAKEATDSVELAEMGSSAALSDPRPMAPPATTPTLFAAVRPTDPEQNAAKPDCQLRIS
jgi:hypothetical protein